MNNNNNQNNQIYIELTEEVGQGIYSNLAVITHSTSEFIIDFIRIMPGLPKAKVQERIILTPEHAKRLSFALQENLAKFESMNGPIKVNNSPETPPIPINFGGKTGEA